MRVPAEQNLHSQSFHSNVIEFVWIFNDPTGGIQQFIFGFVRDKGFYMESGKIDALGHYLNDPNWAEDLDIRELTDKSVWSCKTWPDTYNNFKNGRDLISLANECLCYMRVV